MKKTLHFKYSLAAFLAITTFALYLPALRNAFVWDDELFVVKNPYIRSLDMRLLKWAFGYSVSYWNPLSWLSHALDYAVWGLNPLGHHLTNIILHATNTFLVVLLAVKLWEAGTSCLDGASATKNKGALIAAGTTGLLFGIHPVHVESVAWIAERKDLLCALFYILGIMTYANFAGSQEPDSRSQKSVRDRSDKADRKKFFTNRYYLLTLGLFALALMSKPMAVTLPAVLLILDWYPLNRIRSFATARAALVEKLPFIALSIADAVITLVAQKTVGALGLMEHTTGWTRVLVGARGVIAYLGKMAWPLDLVPFYPYPKDVSLLSWEFFTVVAAVVGITLILGIAAHKRKFLLAVWLYYGVTLLPVLGIVQAGAQSMADRYTYLPSLGPFLATGVGAAWFWGAVQSRGSGARTAGIAAAALLTACLAYLTVTQTGVWKNSITLWTYVIEKEPDRAPQAYNNRGKAFEHEGRLDRAISDLDKAIVLVPTDGDAYNNRGLVFGKMGRYDKAIDDFDKAITLSPLRYDPHNNKGIVYSKLGMPDKALESFNKSLEINPDQAEVHANRGFVYAMTGRYEKAIADFDRAIDLDRTNAAVYYSRGMLSLRTGRKESAIEDFRKACRLGNNDGCTALQQASYR